MRNYVSASSARPVDAHAPLSVPRKSPSQSWRLSNFAGDPWRLSLLVVVSLASAVIAGNLLFILWMSFSEGVIGSLGTTLSLSAYKELYSDPLIVQVYLNTIGFATVSLAVALAGGIPIAWIVTRTDFSHKTLVFTLMSAAVLIPGFVPAIGWVFLLHPTVGMVNAMLQTILGEGAILSISNIVGMGWVQGLSLAPLAFVLTAATFRAMDPALEEAAAMSGANPLASLILITLRLAWPAILAASIFIFTIGFAAVDTPVIIGWGKRIFTYSTYTLSLLNNGSGPPQYGAAAAASIPLVAWALAMSWLYSKMQSRARRYQVVSGKGYRPTLLRLGKYRWLAAGFIAAFFVLNTVLPVLVLGWTALLPFIQLPSASSLSMVSLDNFRSIDWRSTLVGVRNTVVLMICTATIVTFLSFAFSWIVLRTSSRLRSWFELCAFLPHVVPATLFSISTLLISLFVLSDILPTYGTVGILVFCSVIVRISYGTRMTNSALIQLNKELDEAAQMSGASTGSVIVRVLLPLMAPSLMFTWLWTALLTVRDLTVVMFLTTSNNLTMPYIIWSSFAFGGQGSAAALSLLMLIATLPLIFLYTKALNRWKLI